MSLSDPVPAEPWEPPRPAVVAALVFVLAALTLCWPMLGGAFLVSPQSDQYVAGYAFRFFGAEFFRLDLLFDPILEKLLHLRPGDELVGHGLQRFQAGNLLEIGQNGLDFAEKPLAVVLRRRLRHQRRGQQRSGQEANGMESLHVGFSLRIS